MSVSWIVDRAAAEPTFQLRWIETHGPTVIGRSRNGFGRTVIERMVANAVGGIVHLEFAAGGVAWQLDSPLAGVIFDVRVAQTQSFRR